MTDLVSHSIDTAVKNINFHDWSDIMSDQSTIWAATIYKCQIMADHTWAIPKCINNSKIAYIEISTIIMCQARSKDLVEGCSNICAQSASKRFRDQAHFY